MTPRRSPAGPIVVLILMFAGSSFVGIPAPRGAVQPFGSGASAAPDGRKAAPEGVAGPVRGASDDADWPDATRAWSSPRVIAGSSPAAGAPTARVAQSAERRSEKPQVRGSTPRPSTKPSVRGLAVPASRTPRVTGTQYGIHATWYCGNGSRCTVGYPSDGLYAAISPDLRTWTGRLVRVRYGASSVVVRVIDCDCAAEHSIDLYSSAFERLAPLAVGELTVTLELLEE